MKVGIPKEADGETRVGIVPASLKRLTRAGFQVLVEHDAGHASHFHNEAYCQAGASVVSRAEVMACEHVAGVGFPDVSDLSPGTTLTCIADPFRHPDRVRACLEANVTLLSLDLIPRRLSRAQSMDVNSSQDNLAGYQAVLLGGARVPRAIPMMTTSAGTVKPAKAVVMGSGVAGLQAIATARRMGAIVFASDVRRSAAEQIESVGGRFIEVEGMDDFEDESGYAQPLTDEFVRQVNDRVCEVAQDADLIITTARIFGRSAPITIPASAVAAFKPGSVIVDINADVGGNCQVTRPGQVVTTDNEVTVMGILNLPGTVPTTASAFYSNNVTAFLTSLIEEDAVKLAEDNDVLVGAAPNDDLFVEGMGGVLVCRDGVIHSRQSRLAEVLS